MAVIVLCGMAGAEPPALSWAAETERWGIGISLAAGAAQILHQVRILLMTAHMPPSRAGIYPACICLSRVFK